MGGLFVILLGTIFIPVFIQANPATNRVPSCPRSDCQGSKKFHFISGNSYSYQYEVDVASFVDGISSGAEESRLHLGAKVHFDVHTPCDWTLRVSDVSLQDSEPLDASRKSPIPGETAFRKTLEASTTAFTFRDGLIPHLCPSSDEPAWSVNIKRGILSALQNTMPRFDLDHESFETDATGSCMVDYVFNGAVQNTISVIKTRDLSSCSGRYSQLNSLSSVPYQFIGKNYYDSLPLTNSTSSCQQTIAAKRISHIDCEEKHIVRPFSHEGSGAMTTVRQSLTLIEDIVMEDVDQRIKEHPKSPLLFQHTTKVQDVPADSFLTLPAILQRLCQNVEEGVDTESAALFGRLVNALRSMDYPSLSGVMAEADAMCRDGEAARKYLQNGLVSAGSSDAIATMRDEISRGKVEKNMIHRWIISLAFIPRPTGSHLTAALPLLDVPNRPRQIALSLSSMGKKLCSPSCLPEVSLLVNKLAQPLGRSCESRSREEREEVLLSLRSLATVGQALKEDPLDTVENCFRDRDNPTEVRVSALQTMRNVRCTVRSEAIWKILVDTTEDSEIRITAYLMVMECADYPTFLRIKDLLIHEEVNQVGSFIWTHLRNLATTALPSKLELQALVLDQELVVKFDTDARKFSRNYEQSILLDQYNTAASVESNIIFSQHSYLPRSALLNLTADIFGQSVNLLELGGRFEGFELYIESIFGPGGLYHQKELSQLLQGLRPKRKVNPPGLTSVKLSAMDKQFDAASHFLEEPEMSMSLKLFGNDFGYWRWEGREEILKTFSQLSPVSRMQNMLNGEDKSFSYAAQYIDSTHVIPLSVGLPMKLMARGQVVADVRGNMRTELKSLLKSGKGEISWKLHPSVAVNFDASMTVDAIAVQAGMKFAATLHSSVSTSGKFALDGLKLIDMQIDLPQEKAEIINLKSEIILLHRRLRTPLAGILENRVEASSCSRGPIQRILGLQLCADVSFPNASETEIAPHFPLTGPAHLSVELVKFDPAITSYRFLHHIENEDTLKSWTLTFRPEGSKDAKEVGVKAQIKYDQDNAGHLGFKLMLPSNSYEINGTFKWDEDSKNIEASFIRDVNVQVLVAKASLDRSQRSKQQVAYQPKLVLSWSNKNLVDLGGEFKLTEKKGTTKYDVDLSAKVGTWNTVTKGYYLLDDKSHTSNLTVEYKSDPKGRSEKIKIDLKLNNGTTQGSRQYDVLLGVEPSAYPNRNFVGTWRFQQGHGHLDNQLTIKTGPWQRDGQNTLTINQGFSYSSSGSPQNLLKLRSRLEVTLPAKGVDLALIIGHDQTDYKTDTAFTARYATAKEVQCGLMIQKRPGVLFHATGAFNLTLPSQPVIKFSGQVQEQSKNNYRTDLDGVWGHETDFQLSGSYSNQIKSTHSDQDVKVEVTGSTILPIEFTYSFHTNQSTLEAQIQSSYGKDALSLYLARDNPSKNEVKIGTKIGYLNYLHTVDAYWNGIPDGQKGTLDVHVDKVLDIRGDFSTDLASSGRRDTSFDLRWDANRDPQQKLTVKTSFEPGINPNDWTSAVHLSYPGTFIRSNFAANTQRDNRTFTGTIDLGSKRSIVLSAGNYRMDSILITELYVDTPFPGWKHSKAVFSSKMKDNYHKTGALILWGERGFLETGVEAQLSDDGDSKGVEASFGIRSSLDRLPGFKVTARTEMQSRILDSSLIFQWGTDQTIAINSTLEWGFEGQIFLRSELGLTTPFPRLNQVKLELSTNTEWESSQLFENKAALTIEDHKYTVLLKGLKPITTSRWEASALMTTPHPDYEVIGFASHYSTDEKEPSFNIQASWPQNQVGLSIGADFLSENSQRGFIQLKLPFQELKHIALDGAYIPMETAMKFDVGATWNTFEFVTFNTSWEMDSTSSGDFQVDVKTSIRGHENYGTRLAVNLDLSEFPSLNTIIRLVSPIHELGLSVNGSMTEIEDGVVTTGALRFEIAGQPDVTIEFNQDSRAEMEYKSNVLIFRGNNMVNLTAQVTNSDEFLVLLLEGTSPLEQLSSAQFRMRFRKEYLNDPNSELSCSIGAKWESFAKENKVAGQLSYLEVFEELEDFTQKSMYKLVLNARSPWELVERLSVNASVVNENAQMAPVVDIIYNDMVVNVNGNVDFIEQSAKTTVTKKSRSQKKPLTVRMDSAWALEDTQIKVNGTVLTSLPGLSEIPWNLDITMIDSEEDENVWERLINGEAAITKSQKAVLSAALLPNKLTIDLATPFETLKKFDLVFDYERMGGLNTVAAELRVNNNSMELGGNMDWPEESTLPVDAQLTLTTPFDYELVSLNWKSADPLSAAKLSATLTRRSYPYSFEGQYDLALPERIDVQVQMTSGDAMELETIAFKLNSEITVDGFSGLFSVTTPLAGFKNAELTTVMASAEQKYQGSFIIDSSALAGSVQASFIGNDGEGVKGELQLDIQELLKVALKSSVDLGYKNVNFEASVFEWLVESHFQRDEWSKYSWNAKLESDLDRKWLVDLDLDFQDIRRLYRHNATFQAVHDGALYSTYGSFINDDTQYRARLGCDWGAGKPLEVKFTSTKLEKLLGSALFEILTPWTEEPSLSVNIDVDDRKRPREFKIVIETADKIVVTTIDIKFLSLTSMKANAVVATTFHWLPKATLEVNTQSNRDLLNGSYIFTWSDKHTLDLNIYHEEKSGFHSPVLLSKKNLNGNVQFKSSWTKFPEASIRYSRDFKSPLSAESVVQIYHNFTEVIHVSYKSNDQSSAGRELNQGQLEMSGSLLSGGVAFSRLFEYSEGNNGGNLPTNLTRSIEFFKVGHHPKFIIRAELEEKEKETGQEYHVKLSSTSRTVALSTHYDFPDGTFKHGSQFLWRPDARIAYEVEVENRTTSRTNDYIMTAKFVTPVRNMGMTGTVRQSKNNLRAVGEMLWDLERRDSAAKFTFQWENVTRTRDVRSDRIRIGFTQGNLPQELAVLTEVHRSAQHPLNMKTEVQYSKEPERNVAINTLVTSRQGNHRIEMNVTHPVTQLELRQVLAYERNPSGRSQVIHTFSHSRMDAELLVLEHLFVVEPQEKKVFFTASSPMLTMRHQAQVARNGNESVLTYEAYVDDSQPVMTELRYNPDQPLVQFVSHYDPVNRKDLKFRAGIPNKRLMILELFKLDKEERIPVFDFVLRLNHSHLLTSKTRWPADWRDRFTDITEQSKSSASLTADRWWAAFITNTISESAGSVLYIANDIYEVLNTALDNFIDETTKLEADYDKMKQNMIDGYNSNAFYAKIAVELGGAVIRDIPFEAYANDFVASLEKAGNKIFEPFTNQTNSFTLWKQRFGEQVSELQNTISSWLGEQWNWPSSESSRFLEQLSSILHNMAEEYDRFVRRLHQSLLDTFQDLDIPLRSVVKDSWNSIYNAIRPLIVRVFIATEAAAWNVMKEILDYLYEQRDEVVQSTYFQKLSLLLDDLKQLYLDMQSADWPSKMREYVSRAGRFFQQKYSDLDEYLTWLEKFKAEVLTLYQAFIDENPELEKAADSGKKLLAFLQWSYNHLRIDQKFAALLAGLRERGAEVVQQTATDAQMRYSPQKTLFRYNPDLGSIELEQKLPMPWISLDEAPRFEQLPEIQRIRSVLAMFQPSNTSVIDQVLSYIPDNWSLSNWLPPFQSSAHFVSLQHFITFDGRHFDFTGPCTYLLAHDFLTRNFSLAVRFVSSRGKPYASVLNLAVDETQWELDLANQTVRIAGANRFLPTEERGTFAFYEDGKIVINSPVKGIRLECVATYEVCTLTLSGWYNNKVAGLLGTMDGEPTTDQIRPDRTIEMNLPLLARSWDVSPDECKTVENFSRKMTPTDENFSEACDNIFRSPRTTLKKCLPVVDPAPYLNMCLVKSRVKANFEDGCQSAAAYVAACAAKGILVRVPPQCVRCQIDNDFLTEGETREVKMDRSNGRPSSDVVMLLEMKKCNEPDIQSRRYWSSLLSSLDKELSAQKFTKNRFSLVLFGGAEPYNKPIIRTLRGQEFVLAKELDSLFSNLAYGDGTGRADDALRLASQLNFRPGVSKTFVLVSCSSCSAIHEEYNALLQTLVEQDVTLHILTDAEFRFGKPNASRQFLGLDATSGFVSKEIKGRPTGGADLRRQAKLPKTALEMCAPLALETNGTIFSAPKMRKNSAAENKRAVNVWVKRVVATAHPADCQQCTCQVKNYYHSVLDCRTCTPKQPPSIDKSFLEEPVIQQTGKATRTRSREKEHATDSTLIDVSVAEF